MKINNFDDRKIIFKAGFHRFNPFAIDFLWAYHPVVLKKNTEYYLFYTGKGIGSGINHGICIAKSNDLSNWKKIADNILKADNTEWDNDFTAHAFIFKDGNKYKMLYDGSNKKLWCEEIGLAESFDLIHWKKDKNNPIFKVGKEKWEKRHVSRCCVIKHNNEYYLFYAGHDGHRERIGLAKGKDLHNLQRIGKKPILDIGEKGQWDSRSISDPRVIVSGKKFIMFYTGINNEGKEQIGAAISNDLVHWKKIKNNPVIFSTNEGWTKQSVGRGSIFTEKNNQFIFFSAKNKYFYHIGKVSIHISE